MRLARLYILSILVILARCEETKKEKGIPVVSEQEKGSDDATELEAALEDAADNDTLKIVGENPRGLDDGELPVLPPIILLDFANDPDNSSSSGEEKSKRTVDSSLGHGFGRNNFFTGKYNYYFPAGKSGTSVSIEESISPFLPKTIVESVKPITEKTYTGDSSNTFGQNPLQKNPYQSFSGARTKGQASETSANRFPGSQQVFGQRTKLYKPSQIDFNHYQSYTTTSKPPSEAYTTSRPDYRHSSQDTGRNTFATAKPNYSSYSSGFFEEAPPSQRLQAYSTQAPASYVTPTPVEPSYQTLYKASTFNTPRPSLFEAPTSSRPPSQAYSPEASLASFSNLPRFTIENGVRYENKIVWKYPDGKVSHNPPASYVNAYNEFLQKQRQGSPSTSSGYQSFGTYQSSPGSSSFQVGNNAQTFQSPNHPITQIRYQAPAQDNRHPASTFSNIHSKSPAQFPNDQAGRPQRPSQFVSSASLASANHGNSPQSPQPDIYESSFQGDFGQKTSLQGNDPSSSLYPGSLADDIKPSEDTYSPTSYEGQRLIPKYAVNSPNANYVYSTESPVKTTSPSSYKGLFTSSGKLSPKVLSKYSSEAQKYLTKVFTTPAPSTSSESYSTTPSTPIYEPANHDNLLNYHPSITQYIRDPSSILNAQPTFIQAGNSLIPVIILRVDGARPAQPQTTPNINLKALLQQYLTQYAGSLRQNYDNGNYDKNSNVPPATNPSHNPLYELNQLAQSLTQYSQNPSIVNHFAKQFEDNLNKNSYDNSANYASRTNYEALDERKKNQDRNNHPRKIGKQRVKSVEIIEDPRFTSYKVNS